MGASELAWYEVESEQRNLLMRANTFTNKWFILFVVSIPIIGLAVPSGAIFFWHRFYPLPPIPTRTPRYTVVDKGATTRHFRTSGTYQEVCLRDDGTIRDAREQDETQTHSRGSWFRTRTHSEDNYIFLAANGYGVVSRNMTYERYTNYASQTWERNGPVRGYHWSLYRTGNLSKINIQGNVIGNSRIDTDAPSCTGNYYGHGRSIPLLWRFDRSEVEDLNTLIAENTGWYIDQTLDITDRGQILCIARRTDAKGAEKYNSGSRHLVVLTPTKAP